MFDRSLIQRKADVRGVYPNQINEELAWFVGQCLVQYVAQTTKCDKPRIIVGRDGRTSSPALYSSLIQGIASAGGVPMPCGLATTDMVQWGVGEQLDGAIAGVMITASHNPPEYNGIKSVLFNKATGGLDMISPLLHLAPLFEAGTANGAAAAAACAPFAIGPNLRLQEKFTDAACERSKNLAQASGHVVLDPGNGVGGLFVPLLKQALAARKSNAEISAVAERIDGTFPTRPSNPGLPGAVKLLQQTVIERGARFGAAFDGDADRVFLVDEWGQFVSGSLLLAALGQNAIRKALAAGRKNPAVVYSAVSSWLVVETMRKAGGRPVVSRVGQDALKVALIKTDAVFGGESSAHYNYPESYGLDSGLFSMVDFWDMLLTSGQSCSELLSSLAPWPSSGEVNLRVESNDWKQTSKQIIEALTKQYNDPSADAYVFTLDGVGVFHPRSPKIKTVDDLFLIDTKNDPTGATYRTVADGYTPKWWMNVRASNNEPLLRLNVEAQSTADVTGRTYSLISWVQKFCEENNAKVTVEDWGNLRSA